MRITYSKDADVLYLSFTPATGKVATVENANGDLLRIDTTTGKIIGVTIQLFMYRIGTGEKIEIPEVGFTSDSPIGVAFVESIRVKTH
jgi:uncharacterized protein YuzE